MPIPANNETNLIKIFVTKIYSTNGLNQNHYICFIEFDIKEPATCAKAMQGLNISQWV